MRYQRRVGGHVGAAVDDVEIEGAAIVEGHGVDERDLDGVEAGPHRDRVRAPFRDHVAAEIEPFDLERDGARHRTRNVVEALGAAERAARRELELAGLIAAGHEREVGDVREPRVRDRRIEAQGELELVGAGAAGRQRDARE